MSLAERRHFDHISGREQELSAEKVLVFDNLFKYSEGNIGVRIFRKSVFVTVKCLVNHAVLLVLKKGICLEGNRFCDISEG